ncbi:unnamed protein product [Pocillopora meandrina]|uniref:Cortactin-binding protein-2 N-terminal domain-containing protein n=1 Tax=Pocillopora meandrina TaxID=46732 RepID=A0AAU9WHS8_9CNID|nr:unnamed protein product [Pocillopora meandrina]
MAFSPCEGYYNTGDQSRFENMMKLLLFLEAELQLKEEIIELLLEDERNQDILNEKLTLLNRKEQHDPVLALGRDNVYEEELWEEHFDEWESGKDSSFDHLVKSNASQLCAVAAMRTIEMAQVQHAKYIKTYKSLEKTGRSYKKLKQQLTAKETKVEVKDTNREPESDWEIRELEMKIGELYLQIDSERERNEELERKIEELNTSINKERRRCKKVIETLANEVERLTNLVKAQGRNGHHLNGFKMNHDRQESAKMGSNNHMKTFSISNNNELKQFCVL